ncbi:NUDIX domain-containing protein [Candidatus Falkowbacteria bacterium]|jgi:8-oxo-dGTP pyrophosphatase MutT (NUDIX family)|nr:NUDIX domain-containing protein [Candidatus Falkowbacteria bacterium]MBT4432845.1 NUDIX domain-containing protein [Candidatus Falkowbacteria bacterium]
MRKKRIIVCGIVYSNNKVLLGRKAKGVPPYPDVWHTLGGGVKDTDKAEQLLLNNTYNASYFLEELRRELAEEAGIKINNSTNICPKYRDNPREAIAANKDGDETKYIFLEYLCELDLSSSDGRPGDDIAELQWVEKKDLRNIKLTPPSQEMYQELGWM